jgi:hypothetical protein
VHIVLPDGKPIERALDAYMLAMSLDKGAEFISMFSKYVWGRGVDVGKLFKPYCTLLGVGVQVLCVGSTRTPRK